MKEGIEAVRALSRFSEVRPHRAYQRCMSAPRQRYLLTYLAVGQGE